MKARNAIALFLSRNIYVSWLLLLLLHGAITLYNGYPVLYSDTSTYLSSGFELEAPADRPIVYGLLLTLFSFGGLTLYSVPFIQSLIYLYVLKRVCEVFFEKEKVQLNLFFLSSIVLLLTGFGWSLNLLLPDFFTPVGFLCIYCLFVSTKKPKQEWLLFVIFFISAAAHIANIFSYLAVLLFFVLGRTVLFKDANKKFLNIKLAICVSSLLIAYLIAGSAISKSKNVFMMGNLAQKGILQEVLKDKCSEESFALCHYKDSIPQSFEYFVWNKNSPLYKLGGWKENKQEYKKIIGLSFSEKKYLEMHLTTSFKNFITQLGTFGIGEGTGPFNEESVLIKRIRNFILLDKTACIHTKQMQKTFINMNKINMTYKLLMILIFLIFTGLIILRYKKLSKSLKLLICTTLILILGTSVLVAFTAEVSNRYGCRMAWLILLLNFLILSAGKEKTELN